MNIDLVFAAAPTVPDVIAACATYRFGRAQGRLDEGHVRRKGAATELTERLLELRRLVRGHGWVELGEREVPDAFAAWCDAFDRRRTRLPDSWQRLGRSVRAAAGEAFGAAVFIDRRPDVVTIPLGEPDLVWQRSADEYFTYCLDALALWADDDPRAPTEFLVWDTWLARTGRHEPFEQHQEA